MTMARHKLNLIKIVSIILACVIILFLAGATSVFLNKLSSSTPKTVIGTNSTIAAKISTISSTPLATMITKPAITAILPAPEYVSGGSASFTNGYNYGKLTLNNSYKYYICGAAVKSSSPEIAGLANTSWIGNAGVQGHSSIGMQSSDNCTVSTYGTAQGTSIVGLGTNVAPNLLYGTSVNLTNSSFILNQSRSLLVVIVTGIFWPRQIEDNPCLPFFITNESLYTYACGKNTVCAYTCLEEGANTSQYLYGPRLKAPGGSNCYVANWETFGSDLHPSVATLFVCAPARNGNYQVNQTMLSDSAIAVYTFGVT